MEVNDIIELKVDKLVYEGAGLCDLNGFKVFVENVLPDEEIKAKIYKIAKNYAKAQLIEVIKPSLKRVSPFCPLYNACGGCCWQHIDYNEQLKQKTLILKDIFPQIEIKETIKSQQNKEFRHKIQMPVCQTKNSKRFIIGYYKKNSHELTNIKFCPVQSKIINEIIEKIRETAPLYEITAYNEKKHKGELRHVIFKQSSSSGSVLAVFVVNNDKISARIKNLAQKIFDEFEAVKGICVNFNMQKSNKIMSEKTQKLFGDDFVIEKLGEITYQISANSFFQTNPQSAINLFETVKNYAKRLKSPSILDAYSGVSSIGLYLKDIAKSVVCVEEVPSAIYDADINIKNNNAKNFELIKGDVKKIFKELIDKQKTFDVVLLDPPRSGCDVESLDLVAKMAQKMIIYVSCNPMSLKRDLKILEEKGFKLKEISPVDMFCHTYHVESVALFEK